MLTALPARATAMFLPPFSTPDQYLSDLAQRGFAVLPATAVRALSGDRHHVDLRPLDN